jgi:hypothetical protein
MPRNTYFGRDSENFESDKSTNKSPDWLTEFAIAYEKQAETAVDAARQRQADADFALQISNIISGKPKHATVESVVKEYQELTGLTKYLKTLAEQESSSKHKIAQNVEDLSFLPPKLMEKVKTFIDNKISSYNGFISIPAIQDDLLRTLKQDGLNAHEVYDFKMANYIGSKLADFNKNNTNDSVNPDLGKAVIEIQDDGSNSNFLHSLTKKQ